MDGGWIAQYVHAVPATLLTAVSPDARPAKWKDPSLSRGPVPVSAPRDV